MIFTSACGLCWLTQMPFLHVDKVTDASDCVNRVTGTCGVCWQGDRWLWCVLAGLWSADAGAVQGASRWHSADAGTWQLQDPHCRQHSAVIQRHAAQRGWHNHSYLLLQGQPSFKSHLFHKVVFLSAVQQNLSAQLWCLRGHLWYQHYQRLSSISVILVSFILHPTNHVCDVLSVTGCWPVSTSHVCDVLSTSHVYNVLSAVGCWWTASHVCNVFSVTGCWLLHQSCLWCPFCRRVLVNHQSCLWCPFCHRVLVNHQSCLWCPFCRRVLVNHQSCLWCPFCHRVLMNHQSWLWCPFCHRVLVNHQSCLCCPFCHRVSVNHQSCLWCPFCHRMLMNHQSWLWCPFCHRVLVNHLCFWPPLCCVLSTTLCELLALMRAWVPLRPSTPQPHRLASAWPVPTGSHDWSVKRCCSNNDKVFMQIYGK